MYFHRSLSLVSPFLPPVKEKRTFCVLPTAKAGVAILVGTLFQALLLCRHCPCGDILQFFYFFSLNLRSGLELEEGLD